MKIVRLRNSGELELKNEIIEYPPELEGNRNLFTGLYTGHANHPNYNINNWTGAVVKIKPNTTYTVKRNSPSNRFQIMTGRLDNGIYASMTQVTRTVGNYNENHVDVALTITSGENDEYLVVYLSNQGHFNDILLKVEEGSKSTSYTPSPEDLGLDYPNFIKKFNQKIYPHGVILTPEIIEFPIELTGKRNLFSGEFYRDINNFDGVLTYRYHLTDLKSNKRYVIRSWLKEGEVAENGFWITLTSGHPNPNNASANGGTYSHIINNGNPVNSQVLPRENVPVYVSYYPPSADPSILDKYNISIQQLDSGYVQEWTPAPYDLGVNYTEDISSFGIRPFGDMTMVSEIIEDCSFEEWFWLDFVPYDTSVSGNSKVRVNSQIIPYDCTLHMSLVGNQQHECFWYINGESLCARKMVTGGGEWTDNQSISISAGDELYIVVGTTLTTTTIEDTLILRLDGENGIKVAEFDFVLEPTCYLTTAMVGYFNKADDGIELTAMRELRSHSGYKYQDVLEEYAQMSPIIIRGIEQSENKDCYYNMIKDVVDNIVIWVADEEWERAETAYLELYYYLKKVGCLNEIKSSQI